jgi:hypothetical protein
MLRGAPFGTKALVSQRYTISFQQAQVRVTLPEALYDDLYWARNQFLHGMPVRSGMLHYRQSKAYAPLARIAPVLFNAAWVSYLNQIGIGGSPMDFSRLTIKNLARYMASHSGIERVERGIAAAAAAG